MGITNNIRNMTGIITVQIEGFFTERFINLCRINNIKIWEIRNIVKGVIRFKMNIADFKKLRSITKKTKCKVSIKEKKGLYFTLFKYRKRKLIFVFLFLIIVFSIAFSTFIWDIDIVGNERVSKEIIISKLKDSGLYIGRNKIGLDKKEVVNELRAMENELSWVGIEIDGTRAIVKVVEKTRMDEKNIQQTSIGDIKATKSGVITKLVSESGTSKFKALDYVNKGDTLIEGNVYDRNEQIIGEVPAKGYARVDNIYTFEKELHSEIEKIAIMDELPINWTYPEIQPKLLEEARKRGFLPKKEEIKWLFFDVGSTLVDESKVYEDRMKRIADLSGLTYEQINKYAMSFYKENKKGDLEVARQLGVKLPKWESQYERLYTDTKDCLKKLSRIYKIGVIANQSLGTSERLENLGVRKYLDLIIASAEEGVSKPDRRIFEIALERSRCRPENAVMIGDRIDNDIVPAKQLGMKTIWVKQGFGSLWNITDESEKADIEINNLSDILKYL